MRAPRWRARSASWRSAVTITTEAGSGALRTVSSSHSSADGAKTTRGRCDCALGVAPRTGPVEDDAELRRGVLEGGHAFEQAGADLFAPPAAAVVAAQHPGVEHVEAVHQPSLVAHGGGSVRLVPTLAPLAARPEEPGLRCGSEASRLAALAGACTRLATPAQPSPNASTPATTIPVWTPPAHRLLSTLPLPVPATLGPGCGGGGHGRRDRMPRSVGAERRGRNDAAEKRRIRFRGDARVDSVSRGRAGGEAALAHSSLSISAPRKGQLSLEGPLPIELGLPTGADASTLVVTVDGAPVDPASLTITGSRVRGTLAGLLAGRHTLDVSVGAPRGTQARSSWFELVVLENPDECEILNQASCMLPFPSSRFLERARTETGYRVVYGPNTLPLFNRLETPLTIPPVILDTKPADPTPYLQNDGFSPTVQVLMNFPGGFDPVLSDAPRLDPTTRTSTAAATTTRAPPC